MNTYRVAMAVDKLYWTQPVCVVDRYGHGVISEYSCSHSMWDPARPLRDSLISVSTDVVHRFVKRRPACQEGRAA